MKKISNTFSTLYMLANALRMTTLQIGFVYICSISNSFSQDFTYQIIPRNESLLPSCIQVAANDVNTQQITTLPPQNKKPPAYKDNKQLIEPIKEAEMEPFIKAIKPVKSKDGKSWGLGVMVSGSNFTFERLGLIIDDATILLATLHSQQALARLENAPTEFRPTAYHLQEALKKITACGEQRFTGRGGKSAYNESMRLVRQYQEQLEPLILYQMIGSIHLRTIK